jgi:hypothetical protein
LISGYFRNSPSLPSVGTNHRVREVADRPRRISRMVRENLLQVADVRAEVRDGLWGDVPGPGQIDQPVHETDQVADHLADSAELLSGGLPCYPGRRSDEEGDSGLRGVSGFTGARRVSGRSRAGFDYQVQRSHIKEKPGLPRRSAHGGPQGPDVGIQSAAVTGPAAAGAELRHGSRHQNPPVRDRTSHLAGKIDEVGRSPTLRGGVAKPVGHGSGHWGEFSGQKPEGRVGARGTAAFPLLEGRRLEGRLGVFTRRST